MELTEPGPIAGWRRTCELYERALPGRPPSAVVSAVLGMDRMQASRLARLHAAFSPEIESLLAGAPELFRTATRQFHSVSERCVGGIRGPVNWAETLTAWSSGLGVDEIYICSIPTQDFATAENQLLAWCCKQVASTHEALDSAASLVFGEDELRVIGGRIRAARQLLGEEPLKHASQKAPRAQALPRAGRPLAARRASRRGSRR